MSVLRVGDKGNNQPSAEGWKEPNLEFFIKGTWGLYPSRSDVIHMPPGQ